MRSIWMILGTVAIANMMALAVFFGWLASTDRLSRERVDAVRKMFVETSAQETVRREAEAKESEQAALLAEAERTKGFPPLTADQRLELIREYADLISQRTERTRRETQDLINTLLAQQARVQQDRQRLEEDRTAFESMRAAIAALEGSEQFQKSLKVYQTLKPDVAASMLMELVGVGDLDQVTAYLDAMSPRTASRILTEFEKDSPALAADLVERLRVRGVEASKPPRTRVVADGAVGG
jgi:flagellar motility protein MotE (MotC chaperone)